MLMHLVKLGKAFGEAGRSVVASLTTEMYVYTAWEATTLERR